MKINKLIPLLILCNSVIASELTPAWIDNPPDNTASGCSSLTHGETLALRIAKAKGLAELSRIHSLKVSSNQEITKETHNGQLIKSDFKDTTNVTSDETFNQATIINRANIESNGEQQLCVLVGQKGYESPKVALGQKK